MTDLLTKRRDFLKIAVAGAVGAGVARGRETSKDDRVDGGPRPLGIVVYLYPGMTALDAIGTYEVLRGIPNSTTRFVAKERGLVRMDSQTLSLNADYAIRETDAADILVLPGGLGTEAQMQDKEVLAWVRRLHEKTKWTTSVCTGSLILAAAGLLKGLEATTHWAAMDYLAIFGAKPTHQRVVRQGKIITAAGVSSGIDMALKLVALEAGDDVAEVTQLTIEYDPQPPFNSGSVEKASPATVARAKAALDLGRRRATGMR